MMLKLDEEERLKCINIIEKQLRKILIYDDSKIKNFKNMINYGID